MATPTLGNFNTGNFLGGSMIGSGLGGLFGMSTYHDPSKAAMPYLNQVPGTISPYFQPYINAGTGALGNIQQQYGNLINDPTALMAKLGANYKSSPGFQFNVDEATRAANQAAAAGGMLGSPQEQQELAKAISGYASQDYNNYLNQALGLYGQGLGGMGGLAQMGYGAGSTLAQMLQNNLNTQANLAYAGQVGRNQAQGGAFGGLGSILGGIAGFLPKF